MIASKEDSQDKFGRKVDRNMNKSKKFIPLMERDFNDLHTLKDQFEWLKQKRRQKDRKNGTK